VLLVRAHIDLIDVIQNPGSAPRASGSPSRSSRAAARPGKCDELYILPLRAIAAQLAEDGAAARDCANLLLRSAPSSAETFLLSAILFLKAERIDLAADEVYDAARMDPKNWDSSILRVYLRWLEVLNDPVHEKLETAAEGRWTSRRCARRSTRSFATTTIPRRCCCAR
jgi:hypothetical protein